MNLEKFIVEATIFHHFSIYGNGVVKLVDNTSFDRMIRNLGMEDYFDINEDVCYVMIEEAHDLYKKIKEEYQQIRDEIEVFYSVNLIDGMFAYRYLLLDKNFDKFNYALDLDEYKDLRFAVLEEKEMIPAEVFFYYENLFEENLINNFDKLENYDIFMDAESFLGLTQKNFEENIITRRELIEHFDDIDIVKRIYEKGVFLIDEYKKFKSRNTTDSSSNL